jgi:uncharacterized protein YkwD
MKRITECIIVFTTLAAIVSTFFLYQSHAINPQLTASVITSDQSIVTTTTPGTPAASTTKEVPTSETYSTYDTYTEKLEAETAENEIVIEKLPISEGEIKTLTTKIHSLTNLSRSQNNLPSLTLDTTLSAIAKQRSEEMVREDYFSHISPTGCDVTCLIQKSGYQTMSWGENLALSHSYHVYTLPELADSFVADWLKSSAHRDNLLSKKFTHQGIGIASEEDKIIVTVIFATP